MRLKADTSDPWHVVNVATHARALLTLRNYLESPVERNVHVFFLTVAGNWSNIIQRDLQMPGEELNP